MVNNNGIKEEIKTRDILNENKLLTIGCCGTTNVIQRRKFMAIKSHTRSKEKNASERTKLTVREARKISNVNK